MIKSTHLDIVQALTTFYVIDKIEGNCCRFENMGENDDIYVSNPNFNLDLQMSIIIIIQPIGLSKINLSIHN